MHVSTGYARIARRSAARFLSKRQTLPPRLGFWVGALSLGALTSVAFLLWRVRHERAPSSATPLATGGTAEPEASTGVATQELRFSQRQEPERQQTEWQEPERQQTEWQPSEPPPERVALAAAGECGVATARAPASSSPSAPVASDPWDVQAARAVTLGSTGELRRIAGGMEREGWDSEAGLLRNYALLLERSSASRERVLAEVSRMLEAAGRLRARAVAREKADTTHAASAGPAPASEGAESRVDDPIQPLPVLAIGKAVSA